MQPSHWRVIANVFLPWLTAKFLFKPKVGPLRQDRILDRLAFWRSVAGIVAVMISTYRYQDVTQVSGNVLLKMMQTGVIALLLPPLAFLTMLIVTRPGRRGQLVPGGGRLLGRVALALAILLLPFLLLHLMDGKGINIPDPGPFILLIFLAPLIFLWFGCLWYCTIYWAARTGLWTAEIHPLLAPIGTTVLMLAVNGLEFSEGPANGVPYLLWLTLNLCGTTTSLALAVLEYRHLRSVGYRFRSGPEPVTRGEPAPEPVAVT